jgi:hypothetical protein
MDPEGAVKNSRSHPSSLSCFQNENKRRFFFGVSPFNRKCCSKRFKCSSAFLRPRFAALRTGASFKPFNLAGAILRNDLLELAAGYRLEAAIRRISK